ncbi:MAG: lipoyl(octanoyl) transferase LipB [Opitutales bacterium]
MDTIEQLKDEWIVEDWGTVDYSEALSRQLQYVEERKAGKRPDTLALLEHPATYTLGARKGAEQHLIWDESTRKQHGIELIKSNRGGDVTYHGPGQIVGYVICDARARGDLHAVLRAIEDLLIQTLSDFSLSGTRREGKTGIWFGERKVAAIGVAVKSWITYHGFALNVNPNLGHFSGIVPCGITDGTVTSLAKEMDQAPTLNEAKVKLACHFSGLRRALEGEKSWR